MVAVDLAAARGQPDPFLDSIRAIEFVPGCRFGLGHRRTCAPASATHTLNHMVQHNQPPFNASFAALADATRRGVLEQLTLADASITDLADRFDMTLTGMKKHVGVLERAGLVTTEKIGRVRTCRIGPSRLEAEMQWIARYREVWDARFDALDRVVDQLKRRDKLRRHRNTRTSS